MSDCYSQAASVSFARKGSRKCESFYVESPIKLFLCNRNSTEARVSLA